jgi:competence protein ComEC
MVRLTLRTGENPGRPPRVRVNVPLEQADPDLQDGALIQLRARLMPAAMPALPGAYNFSERAWFLGLGATGQALGEIRILRSAEPLFALPAAAVGSCPVANVRRCRCYWRNIGDRGSQRDR